MSAVTDVERIAFTIALTVIFVLGILFVRRLNERRLTDADAERRLTDAERRLAEAERRLSDAERQSLVKRRQRATVSFIAATAD